MVAGELKLNKETSTGQKRGVDAIYVHSGFDESTLQNDIALLAVGVLFIFHTVCTFKFLIDDIYAAVEEAVSAYGGGYGCTLNHTTSDTRHGVSGGWVGIPIGRKFLRIFPIMVEQSPLYDSNR